MSSAGSLIPRSTVCCLGRLLAIASLATAGPLHAEDIKVATIAPDGSHWLREMRAGGDRIKELTEGRVSIKFYPGGVMGNDVQVLRKIRIGQLHGGAFTAGGLGERYSALNLYGIPLLFRSLDEVDYVRERMDELLADGLEKAGFVSFGFIEGGFAQLMANEPVASVEDMRRRKVWIPEGDQIAFMALEALGLSPVTLPPTDVLTGLQTGLLDVVAASPVAALVLQWHTKVKYVTELPIAYSMGIFGIDASVFNRLSEEDQSVFREVMAEVVSSLDETARQDNREARAVLEDAGLQFVSVNPNAVGGWRQTVRSIYPQLRQRRDVDAEVLDQLLGHLDAYRASAAGTSNPATQRQAAQ